MTDRRRHRGPHPTDHELFASAMVATLRRATADLSWLLSGGYGDRSALSLVGDRYQLMERQRTAVRRCSCSDTALKRRSGRRFHRKGLHRDVVIDGFNLLTTIEVALSGGVLIRGRDGSLRDMASMHGTWRSVEETRPALELIGVHLAAQQTSKVSWLLDRPVSNSGRLAGLIRDVAADRGWNWTAELHDDPDQQLIESSDCVIITADSMILDHVDCWWPLADDVVRNRCPGAWIADLS